MAESFLVRIEKEELTFCAAHFITYAGNICERLHGHNYRVAVEVAGPLDENHYVVDFVAFGEMLRAIILELDHRVLLPTEHAQIRVAHNASEVVATFAERRWVFPRDDCALLPVANTTAELLARLIGQRLLTGLQERLGLIPTGLEVAVDESAGQRGVWRM